MTAVIRQTMLAAMAVIFVFLMVFDTRPSGSTFAGRLTKGLLSTPYHNSSIAGDRPMHCKDYGPEGCAHLNIPSCPTRGSLMKIVPKKITSQWDQDGVISSIFDAIGETNRFFVEFGFNHDEWLGASGPNTYQLHLDGWDGLLLDGENENEEINLHAHFLHEHNIAWIFDMYSVPKELDFLSVDVDNYDVWLLRALFMAGYRPRVILIEYNQNFPLDSCVVTGWWAPPSDGFSRAYGNSLGGIVAMAKEFGYALVHVVKVLDAVLVRCEDMEANNFIAPRQKRWKGATCENTLQPAPKKEESRWIDYCVWTETLDREKAAEAGRKAVAAQREPCSFYRKEGAAKRGADAEEDGAADAE